MRDYVPLPLISGLAVTGTLIINAWLASAMPLPDETQPSALVSTPNAPVALLDVEPTLVDESPVLQRWLEAVPDVLQDIRQEPSFRSRLRVGYIHTSDSDSGGFQIGVEDLFLGRTSLTLNGEYKGGFEGDRATYGATLRYYLLPLGDYVNLAPLAGYRHLELNRSTVEGVEVGVRLIMALSRSGGADISVTQHWVSPGTESEVSLTTFAVGYALTQELRLSTDWQLQHSNDEQEDQVGFALEWMF